MKYLVVIPLLVALLLVNFVAIASYFLLGLFILIISIPLGTIMVMILLDDSIE